MKVVDGETLITADGETIKLAGIKAPELWPEDSPYNSWPHAKQSRNLLSKEATEKTLELFCEGETITYDNARIAHILLPDGHWLQERLVSAGAAYVFPRANHTSGIKALYTAELTAREQTKGLWAIETSTLTNADDNIRTGWFHIIQGTIVSAKKVRQNIYLNFAEDWRSDFTVEIPARTKRSFDKMAIDPLSLQGQTIEVRGWVDWKNGPRIIIEGPGQIRLLTTVN